MIMCGLVSHVGKRPAWRGKLRHGDQYLLNKYFHSFERDPIAQGALNVSMRAGTCVVTMFVLSGSKQC